MNTTQLMMGTLGLVVRLTTASSMLAGLAASASTDAERLRLLGKREGVELALSYMREELL